MTLNPVAQKTVLTQIKISAWSGNKLDKQTTDEIRTQKHADGHIGNFRKALIDRKDLSGIQRVVSEARAYHYEHTLPWLDEGQRLLPATKLDGYSVFMKSLALDFDREVGDFLAHYPKAVDMAKTRLGDLFVQADYPSVEQLRNQFMFTFTVSPVPTGDDFRVAVDAEIKAQVDERLKDALKLALSDTAGRIVRHVSHLVERLEEVDNGSKKGTGGQVRFHASMVQNIKDLVAAMPDFNLSNDKELDAINQDMRAKLSRISVHDLKNDSNVRKSTKSAAKDVLSRAQNYLDLLEGNFGQTQEQKAEKVVDLAVKRSSKKAKA